MMAVTTDVGAQVSPASTLQPPAATPGEVVVRKTRVWPRVLAWTGGILGGLLVVLVALGVWSANHAKLQDMTAQALSVATERGANRTDLSKDIAALDSGTAWTFFCEGLTTKATPCGAPTLPVTKDLGTYRVQFGMQGSTEAWAQVKATMPLRVLGLNLWEQHITTAVTCKFIITDFRSTKSSGNTTTSADYGTDCRAID